MARKKTFSYKKRSKEKLQKRAEQQGGLFDSVYKDKFSTFVPKEGSHRLRVMPPTWDDADHYGYDVWLHSSVGPDNQTYVCLNEMNKGACPLCEERAKAQRRGDDEYASELRPYRRVLMWVVNRATEDEGPVLYPMPWSMDRDITAMSIDKQSGEILYVDDPEEGFDLDFERRGTGMTTKYVGIAIGRRSSPLADDEDVSDKWLNFITDNPLTDVINFFDYEHISKVFSGGAAASTDDDDDDDDDDAVVIDADDDDDDNEADAVDIDDDDDDDEEPQTGMRRRQRVRN